jgi:hypothetical protein
VRAIRKRRGHVVQRRKTNLGPRQKDRIVLRVGVRACDELFPMTPFSKRWSGLPRLSWSPITGIMLLSTAGGSNGKTWIPT